MSHKNGKLIYTGTFRCLRGGLRPRYVIAGSRWYALFSHPNPKQSPWTFIAACDICKVHIFWGVHPMIPSAQSFLLTPISTAGCGEGQLALCLCSAGRNNDVPAEPQSSPWLCPSEVNPARFLAWPSFRTVYCLTIRVECIASGLVRRLTRSPKITGSPKSI